ncbi:DUF397 domain-containing protein [Thermomonospora catenispora]|uniref:DUF397 domain-containing protein n=1 Tax=Thermomonospora catenispora TaxID=2493090 RepID=UPI001121DF74|nr:DUF397 domain-containing protein [Thermomonospora catenispora]TNY38007.1 DUF397 domain-containing protein [Thermomonospora catenispora]
MGDQFKEHAAVTWRKSSTSDVGGCVEIARLPSFLLVRDSKDPGGPRLAFSLAGWAELMLRIRRGDLDLRR